MTEGISLVKTDDIPVGRSLNDVVLPEENEARENEVDSLLVERIARFFGTHTLQFKVPKDSIQDMQRALEECKYKFPFTTGTVKTYNNSYIQWQEESLLNRDIKRQKQKNIKKSDLLFLAANTHITYGAGLNVG